MPDIGGSLSGLHYACNWEDVNVTNLYDQTCLTAFRFTSTELQIFPQDVELSFSVGTLPLQCLMVKTLSTFPIRKVLIDVELLSSHFLIVNMRSGHCACGYPDNY